jgi:Zn-dependent peptidase ImmA (M78 family)
MQLAFSLNLPFEPDVIASDQHFRCLASARASERRIVLERADLVWELTRLLPLSLGRFSLLGDVRDGDLARAPSGLADWVRKVWEIDGPIDDLLTLIEDSGVIVAPMPEVSRIISAFSCWYDEMPIMLVGGSANRRRSRFDAAHELGHLLMHRDSDLNLKAVEREANQFAGALLLPASELQGVFRPLDWTKLRLASGEYGVTSAALLTRCAEIGEISPVVFRAAMARASGLGWRVNDPDDWAQPERPTRLAQSVDSALAYARDTDTNPGRWRIVENLRESVLAPDRAQIGYLGH